MMKEKSRTKYTVLGILAIEPFTGYEILKVIETSTNHFWSESEGQIYPALAQCVKDGYATCKQDNLKDSKRIRKVYTITTKGRKALKEWLQKQAQPPLVRNELLLKLFFGNNVGEQSNLDHLLKCKKEVEEECSTYKVIKEDLIKNYKNSPHLKYWLITLDYGIKLTKSKLAWCKESIKALS